MAILLVEHDMNFVMSVCDDLVVLDFGRKIGEGRPEDVRRDPAVIAAYLGVDDGHGEAPVAAGAPAGAGGPPAAGAPPGTGAPAGDAASPVASVREERRP
jgi:hypothetical protein